MQVFIKEFKPGQEELCYAAQRFAGLDTGARENLEKKEGLGVSGGRLVFLTIVVSSLFTTG